LTREGGEFTRKELIFDPLAERIDALYEKVIDSSDMARKEPKEQTETLKKVNKVLTNIADFDKVIKSADKEVKEILSDDNVKESAKSLKSIISDYFKGSKNPVKKLGEGIVKGAVKADTFLSRIDGVPKAMREQRLDNLKKRYEPQDTMGVKNLGASEGGKPITIKETRNIIENLLNERAENLPTELIEKKEQQRIRQEEEERLQQEARKKQEQRQEQSKQIKEAAKDLPIAQWQEIAISDYFKESSFTGKIKIIEEAYINKLENLKEGYDAAKAAGVELSSDEFAQSGASQKDIRIIKDVAKFQHEGADITIRDYIINQKAQKDLEEQEKKPAARINRPYAERVRPSDNIQEQNPNTSDRTRHFERLAERGMESFYGLKNSDNNDRGSGPGR
jgi:hypothetical protein